MQVKLKMQWISVVSVFILAFSRQIWAAIDIGYYMLKVTEQCPWTYGICNPFVRQKASYTARLPGEKKYYWGSRAATSPNLPILPDNPRSPHRPHPQKWTLWRLQIRWDNESRIGRWLSDDVLLKLCLCVSDERRVHVCVRRCSVPCCEPN